ncbi:MAG: sigma-70 family RNA polymerase sigma factor [Bryobacterales bacterium]|nr:sigma-70 family RNA polymerase sigma factor [Bryobacteraceae bacterium]MDW8353119.1 sigma-70 family RNA polymerase sigma factor [Bryobacterales bacterium]
MPNLTGGFLKFHEFTADYVKRLAEGDPFVAEHFHAYFSKLFAVRLGRRGRSREFIEDVTQETFRRVLTWLQSGKPVEYPERFGAFVHAISVNVEREMLRPEERYQPMDDADFTDHRADPASALVTDERKRAVRAILAELSERDRRVLELRYLEEWPLEKICQQLGVDAVYVRVVLHRARLRFREKMGDAVPV